MCGIGTNDEVYKPLRPSQVMTSERLVNNAVNVLANEYINLFDLTLDKDLLLNLSSGEPLPNELASKV